jgi:AcrR family transcriptional regulator
MSNSPPPAERRTQILEAALSCFLEHGYAATSIADIRKASGASTGSIYHFFDGKPALALALVQRGVAGWSAAAAAAQNPQATPEEAIKASVGGLVTWGLAHPAELRFLDEIRTLQSTDPAFAPLLDAFGDGRGAGGALYDRWAAEGYVRPLPWSVAHALMLGPAYDFLRLSRILPAPPDAAEFLADAAWNSVRQI